MAGAYKTCTRCGCIFVFRGNKMCDKCVRELDDMFVAVRDFLYENPNATVLEVVEAVEGAQENDIMVFLREGRLEMKEAGDMLRCEKCGVNITRGRLCEKCRNQLNSVLSGKLESGLAQKSAQRGSAGGRGPATGFKSGVNRDR